MNKIQGLFYTQYLQNTVPVIFFLVDTQQRDELGL